MACCVRGYHECKDIEAAATREVLVCGCWRAVVRKIFVVKIYSCKLFSYIFCVRKYFCNEKKSELRYNAVCYYVTVLHGFHSTVEVHDGLRTKEGLCHQDYWDPQWYISL